jgi:hypothetical protein
MSEFQEKLQMIKDGMKDNLNIIENNPALISSNMVDGGIEPHEDPSEDAPQQRAQPPANQRNEKGHRKRKLVSKDRLDEVIADNRAKDAQQQQLLAVLQDQERRLEEAQARVEQSAHYSNVYYEQSLENDEKRILTELENAKENGDIKKEVYMQQRLAEIAAQRQTQLLSKTLHKQQQPAPVNYQDPSYYQPQPVRQQAPINEHYEDFLEDNPWADPRSPEFDPNLRQEVNDFAMELDKNLKFKGQGNMIGTPEYFGALNNIMNEKYGGNGNVNNDNQYDDNDYYEDNRVYEVAPVTKRGSSMADRYVSNNQNPGTNQRRNISLTKEEADIGAGLAPTLSKIYGRRITTEEAIAEYYRQKMLIPSEAPLRGKGYNY